MSKTRTLASKASDGRKNYIINGNFDVWQRAISQTSSGYGSDDMWLNGGVGSLKTHTRQSHTVGQTEVPNNPRFYSRTVVTSVAGAGNSILKQHRIEDVRTLAGEKATLSFYVKADAPKNIAIEFVQYFGTGGTPSASVYEVGSQLVPVSATFSKVEVTVDIPSITGKTIGTDENSFLQMNFWFDAGSNFDARSANLGQQSGTFDISEVQLEKGSVATDFEYRPIGEELVLCNRYYQVGGFHWRFDDSGNTGVAYTSQVVMTAMRASPTIVGTNIGESSGVINTNSTVFDSRVARVSFELSAAGPVARTYWGNLRLDASL